MNIYDLYHPDIFFIHTCVCHAWLLPTGHTALPKAGISKFIELSLIYFNMLINEKRKNRRQMWLMLTSLHLTPHLDSGFCPGDPMMIGSAQRVPLPCVV